MRITHQMSTNNFLRDLNKNNGSLAKYAEQLTSGKKILRASDDPIGTVRSIQANKSISTKEQYLKNVEDAQGFLTETETCLSGINDVFQRLHELATNATNATYGSEQRNSIMQEAKQLQQEIISIANSSYAGKSIFAGYSGSGEPFTVNDSGEILYNGISMSKYSDEINALKKETVEYQIDKNVTFNVNVNGIELMGIGDDNLYNRIGNFITALGDEDIDVSEFDNFKTDFVNAQNEVLSTIADVGGRQARLDLINNRYKDDILNLEERQSNIQDVDESEAIIKWKQSQYAYEAAMQVGAQIQQMTLLDYLR